MKSSPTIIKLTSRRNKILSSILGTAVIVFAIYAIPIKYFFVTAILLIATILISILSEKMLTISSEGIRYVFKWKLKWEDIVSCDLNKEAGILNIQMKDGTSKQITNIKSKYYSDIDASLKLI